MLKMIKYATALTGVVGMLQLTAIPAHADQANVIDDLGDEAAVSVSRLVEALIVRVPYGDLNITSAAGIETLTRRIDRAVKGVCGSRPDTRDVQAHLSRKTCQDEAFLGAMVQVDDLISQRKLAAR